MSMTYYRYFDLIVLSFTFFFLLLALPTLVFADSDDSEILYPVTTEYEEITNLETVKKNFSLSGTSTWYNDWAWLTPNTPGNHVGSIYLNNKLQLDSNFHLEGKLALTLKGDGSNGDGIGIVFHTAEVSQIGLPGGNLGVVGLPNAIALVLDTYKNIGEPEAPYIGIWTTNASGNKSVVKTYPTNIGASGYKEVKYSFDYDANTRIITYQVYTIFNNEVTPIISDNGGAGYQYSIPSSFMEYAFSITGATGGNYNNQYASISNSIIPILVTNTPQVTKQTIKDNNLILELKDKNGVSYPENSTAYVDNREFTVDNNSSITIPNDYTSPINLSITSYKLYNNNKFHALVSESIQYEVVKKVKMTINYIDNFDKEPIFSDALSSTFLKQKDIIEASIGESITEIISQMMTDNTLKLIYDGYINDVSPDSYITNTNNNDQEFVNVQEKDFDIYYCYTPVTQLLSVPGKINFGILSPESLLSKTQTFYPPNLLSNIKMLNTDRTKNWILKVRVSQPILRTTDSKVLDGYMFYKDSNNEIIKLSDQDVILKIQNSSIPLQNFNISSTVLPNDSGIGINLSRYESSDSGIYSGQLEWTLDKMPK